MEAPPPVETWRDTALESEGAHRADRVAAAHDADAAAGGHRLADGARAGGEVVDLEQAHRAVPEDRAGHGEAAPNAAP